MLMNGGRGNFSPHKNCLRKSNYHFFLSGMPPHPPALLTSSHKCLPYVALFCHMFQAMIQHKMESLQITFRKDRYPVTTSRTLCHTHPYLPPLPGEGKGEIKRKRRREGGREREKERKRERGG